MIRALTVLAAVAALAVSAQSASAGSSNTKVAPSGVESFSIDIGTTEKVKDAALRNVSNIDLWVGLVMSGDAYDNEMG